MPDLQTTDFFGRQASARKRTALLVFLYVCAVTLTCAAVAGLAVIIAVITHDSESGRGPDPAMLALFAIGGAVGAALLIAGGTAYRISELGGGGTSVALALGGRPIDPSTTDPDERMVLNVVEEMSIASGVPVPPVFMLENESSINAFAAGYSPGDAVIGVTRGCVHGLTRDEFQGVMAHEFSHILNGDMRLNIRLVGILGGIVLLSLAGYTLMRATYYGSMARSKDNKGVVVILVLGVGLIVIGGIGSMFARLIQAAVSRQREFLADASAVQFTRNPEGIGDALRRMGGAKKRAAIMNPHSREMSHMFFGNAVGASGFLGASLASHPPLKKRIRAVLPTWDGTFLTPRPTKELPKSKSRKPGPRQQLEEVMRERMAPHGHAPTGAAAALPLLALIGTAQLEHAGHARTLLDRLPRALKDAARDPYGCRAVVYALLMHWTGDDASLRIQLNILDTQSDTGVAALVRSLAKDIAPLDKDLRLPLIDLCLGALARLSETQHTTFRAVIHQLAMADNELTTGEWALLRIVETHLDERFKNAKPPAVKYYALGQLGKPISSMLGAIARAGNDEPGEAEKAFQAGAAILARGAGSAMAPDLTFPSAADRTPARLDAALAELRAVAPRAKAKLLEAGAVTVAHDHEVTPAEADLLRAFADLLGVPMPPLLPGQRLV